MAAVTCSVIAGIRAVRHRAHTEYIETGDTQYYHPSAVIREVVWEAREKEQKNEGMYFVVSIYKLQMATFEDSATNGQTDKRTQHKY